jgi:deazaflavin-dependent oxidoreductase (nitroreductase family)
VYRNGWADGEGCPFQAAYDGCVINYEPEARATVSEPIRRALSHSGLIDITTIGRKSGQPRRLEIVYHVLDGRIYISGQPRQRRRSWLANLDANPRFTVHLKRGLVADVPATARIIDDTQERRDVMRRIIETAWHGMDLEEMVAWSPLIEVNVEGLAA